MTYPQAWKRASIHAAIASLLMGTAWSANAAADLPLDTFASASTEMNNFRYRLVDLDPNDGITPGITFFAATDHRAGNEYYAYATGITDPGEDGTNNEYPHEQYAVFGSESEASSQWVASPGGTVISLDGTAYAAIASDHVSSSVRLTSADFAGYGRANYPHWGVSAGPGAQSIDTGSYAGQGSGWSNSGISSVYEPVIDPDTGETVRMEFKGVDYRPDLKSDELPKFVLTGHTSVIFEVDVLATASIYFTRMGDFDPSQLIARGDTGATLHVFRDVPKDGATHWATVEEAEAAVDEQFIHAGASVERYADSEDMQKISRFNESIGFTFMNEEAGDVAGRIEISTSSYLAASAMPVVVPEPGTYALMGLGLVGIGLAARRRDPPPLGVATPGPAH